MTQPTPAATEPPAQAGSNAPENWVERLRARLPKGSHRRKLWNKLALPVNEPSEFLGEQEALIDQLTTHSGDPEKDLQRSAALLAEAQEIYERAEARAAGAQTRATTLQGAVAIAASLLLAGGALILDQTKLHGTGWRALFAVMLVAVTGALVMCGVRALSATSTIHRWHRPSADQIISRSQRYATQANIELAAETLQDYSYNTKIAAWKVAYLAAAAWWFRIALALILAMGVLIGTYTIATDTPSATTTTTTTTTNSSTTSGTPTTTTSTTPKATTPTTTTPTTPNPTPHKSHTPRTQAHTTSVPAPVPSPAMPSSPSS
jgi:hypothetical protein